MKKKTILELDRISQEEFKKKNKIPLIVILDNVRSLNNVGSVFRTSDAFLVKAVYLCGITATPPHPEIHKTALGAEDSVEWHYFEDTNAAVDKLHEEGYIVYAIEQVENSIILSDLQLNKDCKYAVVLGNEVKGVQIHILSSILSLPSGSHSFLRLTPNKLPKVCHTFARKPPKKAFIRLKED